MSRFESEMLKICEDKAEKDGSYAIAYAILSLAREHRKFSEQMTYGWSDVPNAPPGVLEKIGMEMETVGSAISSLADAVDNLERD